MDEMFAIHSSDTWELVRVPPGRAIVGCQWVYTVNIGQDGNIDFFLSAK